MKSTKIKAKTALCAILALLAGWIFYPACDDYLDFYPEGAMEPSGVGFENLDNIFLLVSNAYASMRSNMAHGMPYMAVAGVSSDDDDKGSTSSDEPRMYQINTFRHTADNTLIDEYWRGVYEIVSAANNAICQLPGFLPILSSPDDRDLYECCMAESKFLRAYAYFCLCRTFGGVPLIDTIATADQLNTYPQATREEVYAFIHKDLDEGVKHLYQSYTREWAGRVTRYAAMALKAKAYLYQNEMDSVIKYTDMVINSGKCSLHSDFYKLFRVEAENCEESLFEIQSSDLGNSLGPTAYCEYGYYQGPRQNQPSNMQGWGFKTPSTKLIQFFEDRNDVIRLKATVMYRGSRTPEGDSIYEFCVNPYYNMKVYVPSYQNNWAYNGYAFDHNIRILRYADVLLMNAEAKIALGMNGDEPLNKVRARAGLDPISNATLQDVWDERRAELAMEENRFYDMVRTGRGSELHKNFVVGKNELFPIPSAQIALNPSLTQNPGY